MTVIDYVLIVLVFVGVIVRGIGRGIRSQARLKYGDDPVKKAERIRLGNTLVWSGIGVTVVALLIIIVLLSTEF